MVRVVSNNDVAGLWFLVNGEAGVTIGECSLSETRVATIQVQYGDKDSQQGCDLDDNREDSGKLVCRHSDSYEV